MLSTNNVCTTQTAAIHKPNQRNNTTMFQIFQNVQYNVVQHKKYVKEMTKLYKKLDQDIFREGFKNALHYLFTFGDTSANVDRVIQFVATFCTSLDDEEEFLLFIFEIIFNCQCVSGQSVRYRASQLLAAVLSALGDDASLDDDLCDKLLASQKDRLQDTRGAVRCRAALALQRLQNPLEPDDEVTRAYRFHMSCDPSSSVRRAIVMTIAKCTRNVPFVLERLCDIDEAVRRAAFLYISAISVTQLRVRQRVLTLKVGLTERSQRVRRVVEEILIPSWLSAFKGNIVELLKAIRLDNAHDAKDSQYVAGKLLESLFKRLPISELLEWLPTDKSLRLIPAEKLNKETVWYWRHLAEHLQKIDDDETLETVLPDLVVLTGYIRAIVESPCPAEVEDPVGFSIRQYVLRELGCMLHVYDAADPAGRAALQTLLSDVLTGDYGPLSADVLRAYVSALELVYPEVSPRMEVVSGVINALRDPPEPEAPAPPPPPVDPTEVKIQRARLRVSLNVAMEAQEEAVREQNYALAAECKAKVEDIQKKLEELNVQTPPPPPIPTIKEKLSDADTLNKCLIILNSALDTPQLKNITPMLHMIFSELEVEIFRNPDILENAIETVALYGMLDKEFARENKPFFFANLVDTSNEEVVTKVLKSIVDLLCVHGARVFEEDIDPEKQNESTTNRSKHNTYHSIDVTDDDGNLSESAISMSPSHNTVIELLLKLMDSSYATYRLIIVEGLCRLLYLGHLESPAILSRLLLLWFNPATAEEDGVRQTLGVFFQALCAGVEGAQEQLQRAAAPALRALARAPPASPLAHVDHEAVVRFLVSLTRLNHELIDSQGAMAVVLCSHIARNPNAPEAALMCRMLALLAPPRDGHIVTDLATKLRDLCLKLPDKQSSRNLTRYLGALEAVERNSLNKISNTGVTESSIQPEDTLTTVRATSSLPSSRSRIPSLNNPRGSQKLFLRFMQSRPLARSTHVVINDTVEEEPEIDETSPTDNASKGSEGVTRELHSIEEKCSESQNSSPKSNQMSSETEVETAKDNSDSITCSTEHVKNASDSDSSGISPVKRVKLTKGKKKKLSLKKPSETRPSQAKEKNSKNEKLRDENEKGVKRSRSQRSLVDVDRAKNIQKAKIQPSQTTQNQQEQSSPSWKDRDTSNVTMRRSTVSNPQPGSGSDSAGSNKSAEKHTNKTKKQSKKQPASRPNTRASSSSARSSAGSAPVFDDSDDTQLHTIIYDNDIQQSLLNESNESVDNNTTSKANVTIPETPVASDNSESEPEIIPAKGKRNTKKK